MKSRQSNLIKMFAVFFAAIVMFGAVSGIFSGCVTSEAITLSDSEISLCVGDRYDLTVKDLEEGQSVSWSTSDGDIASVTQLGCVTAKKAGTATITANAGGRKATCEVEVGERELTLSATEKTLINGEEFTLEATVKEFDKVVENAAVEWSSDNSSVVTVSDKGVVKAVGEGTATVKAKVNNTEAACAITVKAKPVELEIISDLADIKNAGVWGLYTDAAEGEYAITGDSGNSGGVVTLSFTEMTADKDYRLVYLPDVPKGEKYTFSCKITFSAASTAENATLWVWAGEEFVPVAIEANTATEYVFEGEIDGGAATGFKIAPAQIAQGEKYTLTVSDFTVSDSNGYELQKITDHNVPTASATWNYWLKGEESSYDISAKNYNYGALSFSAPKIGSELRLVYLPEIEAGKTYKLTFNITVNKTCGTTEGSKVIQFMNYGANGAGAEWMTLESGAQTAKTYEISYPAGANVKPLKFVIQPCNEFELKVTDFVLTEAEPEPPADLYQLEKLSDQNNPAEAGKWYYYTDAEDGQYEIAQAEHADGAVTFSFTKMQGGKQYRLVYQPDIEEGKPFTFKATITLNKDCNDSDNKKVQVLNATYGQSSWLTLTANQPAEFTFSGTAQAGKPVKFDFNPYISASADNIFTFKISDIEVSEKQDPEEPEEPVDPSEDSYNLEKISNQNQPPKAGVWYYYTDASAGVVEAVYNDGTVSITFDKLESGKNYTLVYLPEGTGDYTLTCDVTSNRAGKWVQFKNATFPWLSDFVADQPQQFTYDVKNSNRLLRFALNASPSITADNTLTITISNVVCTPVA